MMKKIPLMYGMLVALCLTFAATDVFAIAAWARKYGFDCTVCHWSVNKLNKTGQDFLRQGNMTGNSDFSDFGRTKLADAFLQYTYGDEKKFTTARFGQISPQLLYIHGTGGRFGKDRAMALTSTLGSTNYKPFQRNYGAEVSQFYKGFMGTVGVLNGTGGSLFNVVDTNSYKDVYATLDYEFNKEGSIVGLYGYHGKFPRAGFDDTFFQVGPMFNYLTNSFTL